MKGVLSKPVHAEQATSAICAILLFLSILQLSLQKLSFTSYKVCRVATVACQARAATSSWMIDLKAFKSRIFEHKLGLFPLCVGLCACKKYELPSKVFTLQMEAFMEQYLLAHIVPDS